MPRRPIPIDPSVGERIQARRELRRWSIRHAASRAGIAHTTWMRIEKGELSTDRYMIANLATALECSVAELTGQPHVPADRVLEAAQATVPDVWRTVVDIAPDEPPVRPAPPLAALKARLDLLEARRTHSDYAAMGHLLPDLLQDLHASTSGPEGREALRLLVNATNAARAMLKGLGHIAEATFAAERCRQVAEHLGEPVPLAVADWGRAIAAVAGGNYRRAATLTTRAADELSRHLTSDDALAVLGMLHLSSAQSLLRAKPGDAFTHLDEATGLAARTGETTTWSLWFGPTNVGIWRMGIHVDAGDAAAALTVSAGLTPGVLPSTERRATYHTEVARACADHGGRHEEAVRALIAAERLAPQVTRGNTAARETARQLLHQAQRASRLYGLCERLGVAD